MNVIDLKKNLSFEEILAPVINKCQIDPEILAVVVFGSFARGEVYRDIDICLFLYPEMDLDKKTEYKHKAGKILIQYSGKFSTIFDISIFSFLPIYIQANVLNEGIILIDKDYDQLFDIYSDKIKEYSLFLPHFKNYLEVD
jgi:predicted nucleotidyltransferase